MYRHTRDRYVNQCNAENHVLSSALIIYVFSVTTDLYSISDHLIILFTVIDCVLLFLILKLTRNMTNLFAYLFFYLLKALMCRNF